MNKNINIQCPICLNSELRYLHTINVSAWAIIGQNLERQEKEFKLHECVHCKHVMCIGDYSEKTFDILYPENFKSVAIKKRPDIYDNIIEYNLSFLQDIPKLLLADFGGGEGDFINKLLTNNFFQKNIQSAIVYEKHPLTKKKNIKFIDLDFNNIKKSGSIISEFNYAFCIHTLEHLINPREFLNFLFKKNKNNFYLYLEVPSNELIDIKNSVTLIYPQHIQYFSLKNLFFLTSSIGFELIKAECEETEGVPRIKCLIRKDNRANISIKEYLNNKDDLRNYITKMVLSGLSQRKISLWGVGNELYEIIKNHEGIKKAIISEDILLIDSKLAGKYLYGTKIYSPKELVGKISKIIITPMELPTIRSIIRDAVRIGFPSEIIVDPYTLYRKEIL
ncbi:hypothetical protein E3V08_00400 [Candidatus Atribacteria bacterium MT.SAG.1]|nr:hypothetical protein E3V08_00400 [Candidatus Atribacteria bacterium MT.SAG.1]